MAMKPFFDLSFRSKIPLWGGLLIVVTSITISASLLVQAYDDLKQGMLASADSLGRSLANTLFAPLLHEDVWRAYELIDAPFRGTPRTHPMQAETLIVINTAGQIVVSTQPEHLPMLAELAQMGSDYADIAPRILTLKKSATHISEYERPDRFYFAIPIADEDTQLGTLILVYSRAEFMDHFLQSAWRAGLIALLIMAVLLPLNWYWGRRMAVPLVQLAERVEKLGARQIPAPLDRGLYPYRDELGMLFDAYHLMLAELREKALLEREVARSERLAVVGRLTAGIAHEINNPLGGMLTAINTLKHHGDPSPLTLKTISLVERGLLQIRDTVGALLVEARVNSRNLSPHDIDDVCTLIQSQAQKKQLTIDQRGTLEAEVPLPATLLRQIFMNLLLNAVQAANEGGVVWYEIGVNKDAFRFAVANDGRKITENQREHLFEPFMTNRKSGHGLGLWVTYQIVQKLRGHIDVSCMDNITQFSVYIPLGEVA